MVAVATDGYLRKQDLLQLRCGGVVFGTDEWGEEAVLRLGRSVRGESTKTGRDQTVRIDYPHSVAILRRRRQGQPAAARVFPIAGAVYDKWWRWAAKECGVDRPPHSARHTGASHDLASGYRSQDQVKRRGRWLADKSVIRYAKTGDWISAVEAQPKWVREKGGLAGSASGEARQAEGGDCLGSVVALNRTRLGRGP